MRPMYLRLAAIIAAATLLATFAGGGRRLALGPNHVVRAQRAITPEEAEWIKTAVARADLDGFADKDTFPACLISRISNNVNRFDAVRICYIRVVSNTSDDQDDDIGGLLVGAEVERERSRLIQERTAQLLQALGLWGATPEQLDGLRGDLTACLAAWGTVVPVNFDKDDTASLDESIVDWCADDLPEFGGLRRKQPTITSLGCPDEVMQDRSFGCSPRTEGDVTLFDWSIDGKGIAQGKNAALTIKTTGRVTIRLIACNGEPDPGTAGNCTTSEQTVTVEPASPVIGSPGCPSSVSAGQAVVCTPTGVSNTNSATAWLWTATGAQIATDSQPTLSVTFTAGGQQTVTVMACNGQRSCTPPITQAVMVGSAPGVQQSGCTPGSGPPPLRVTCTVVLSDTTSATIITWSAPGGSPDSGSDATFITTFAEAGERAISFRACNGMACTPLLGTTISVTTQQAPVIEGLGCSPLTLYTGDTINCSPRIRGTVTRAGWSAPNGMPSSGAGTTFATRYDSTGTQTITLEACNGGACSRQSQSLELLRRPMATPTATPAPAMGCTNWAGTWTTRGLPDLVLTQIGSSVTGTFGGFGRVSGAVSGDAFRGTVTSANGQQYELQMRLGWGTTGGGTLTQPIACSYMAVKIGNEGWRDFQR